MNHELAERRLQQWREEKPFIEGDFFAQRLAQEDLSAEEFKQVLGEPAETVQSRQLNTPDWLVKLEHAYLRFTNDGDEPELEREHLAEFAFANIVHDEADPDAAQENNKAVGFLNFVRPLLRQGLAELREEIQALAREFPQAPFDPNTAVTLMFARLPGKLLRMISRTLVLEMNVARVQGEPEGETPEARFENFVERLRERDRALAILHEYPVLARQLVVVTENWRLVSLEFLRHLCEDWQVIRETFSPENPGALKKLKGDHGWVEFVTPATCTSEAEIERFYQRQGGYLALLYALSATDFHLENLIAAGEQPVFIDLETLFIPSLKKTDGEELDRRVNDILENSIMQSLLLPRRDVESGDADGLELSGLGGEPGQLSPFAAPDWSSQGTDEMVFSRKHKPLRGSANRPTLNGENIQAIAYTEIIVAGFTAVYRLLETYRDELLTENGLLSQFAEDKVRVVLRGTHDYAALNYEGTHPDMLRDALERDRMFDRLWFEVVHRPEMACIIPAERLDLCDGDVPIFHVRTDSRDLLTSRDQALTDFFGESGLARVRRRIAAFHQDYEPKLPAGGAFYGWGGLVYAFTHLGMLWNDEALLQEAHRAAELLAARIEKDEHYNLLAGAAGCIASLLALQQVTPSDKILAAAMKCGDHLLAHAQEMTQGIGWRSRRSQEEPLTGFSYGAAGIAWALLKLAAASEEWRFREAALSALAFERERFSPEHNNWPDLREAAKQAGGTPSFTTAWRHGATGIGLARLSSLEFLKDEFVHAEIHVALQATVAAGSLGNHSLSHGDLGRLELLLQASEILDEPRWREKVYAIAAGILDQMKHDHPLCGNPMTAESPGLMTGLAGIGYGLLRLAEPAHVPSILLLAPPAKNEDSSNSVL